MSLSLHGISKSFGQTAVLRPLSLAVARGELLALLGPSGCGKTTTLRIVAGLQAPDTGSVEIDGQDVTRLPPERRRLGMVFQHYAVWPHLRVSENVAWPLARAGVPRAERAERVREALELVQLQALAERRPHELSGGQLQRVALARAIVARPRLLLLDEPLSNLDAALREEMRAEIRSLQKRLGITTVLVTHDQTEALSMADRVAVINAGSVEQIAPPADIYQRPATAFVARFVGGGNLLDGTCAAGRVRVGSIEVVAPEGTAEGPVQIVVRPEEVQLDPKGAELRVLQQLYQGDRVELRLDLAGQQLRALLPAREAAQAQQTVRVRFAQFTLLAKN